MRNERVATYEKSDTMVAEKANGDNVMFLLKCVIIILFLAVGCMLYRARTFARMRFSSPQSLIQHRSWTRLALWTTLGGVVLVELAVQISGGTWDLVHLAFAIPFLLFLIGLQWLHGFRMPALHKTLGYTCLAAYVGTLATGSILLYNL